MATHEFVNYRCLQCATWFCRISVKDGTWSNDSATLKVGEYGKYCVCFNPSCRSLIWTVQGPKGVYTPTRDQSPAY